MENKDLLQNFIDINENIGWDTSIEYINKTTDAHLKDLVRQYYSGYDFCVDDDVDGGECFEIRSKAIQEIIEYLENE